MDKKKKNEYMREYRKRSVVKKKMVESQKKWRAKNVEEIKRKAHRNYMRRYNETPGGREYNRQHAKDYRKAHPGCSHGKRPTSISAEYREAIVYFLIDRDGLKCQICGEPILNYIEIGVDHKNPVMLGGKNRIENLRLAHRTCNQKDGLRVRKLIHGY